MYQVSKQIHFCYGHRLLKHKGKCARLHGHNAVAEIVCETRDLDENKMVVDFEVISESLKVWINDTLDHRMILSRNDKLVAILKEWREPFYVIDDDPTAEMIAKLIFDEASRKKLPVKKVILWETPTSSASFSA